MTTTLVVLTAVIVTAGRWDTGKGFDIRTAIGTGVYAIFLSVIDNIDSTIAQRLAILVLLGTLYTYAIPLAQDMGLVQK